MATSNTSASGGYLTPVSTPIAEDAALDDIFQKMIVGLTGLEGSLVRPRWQATTPKMPEPNIDWCAIGVNEETPDANAVVTHDGSADGGNGQDKLQRHEDIVVLATFYGPHSKGYAKQVRDGLYIPQNSEELKTNGIAFINTGTIKAVPELINQQWQRRYDLPINFRRVIDRTYAVQNIVAAEVAVEIAEEVGVYGTEINVTQ